MGPDEALLWMQLNQVNPSGAGSLLQTYQNGTSHLYTGSIITALRQIGVPITPLGIANAQRMTMNAINPMTRGLANRNGDDVVGGLADFRIALMAGANGIFI